MPTPHFYVPSLSDLTLTTHSGCQTNKMPLSKYKRNRGFLQKDLILNSRLELRSFFFIGIEGWGWNPAQVLPLSHALSLNALFLCHPQPFPVTGGGGCEFTRIESRDREGIQLVKYFLCKHGGLSMDAQHPCQILGTTACGCTPRAV